MNIIVYADMEDAAPFIELARVIRSEAALEQIEMIRSFDGLKERLHRLPRLIDISILVAATKEQLSDLITLKEFLGGTLIILIVPDQEKDTIAQATKLYPNFIGTMDSSFAIIGAVLEKMLDIRGVRSHGRPW